MPKINVVDKQGKIIEAIELADSVFGIKPNTVVIHMAVVN